MLFPKKLRLKNAFLSFLATMVLVFECLLFFIPKERASCENRIAAVDIHESQSEATEESNEDEGIEKDEKLVENPPSGVVLGDEDLEKQAEKIQQDVKAQEGDENEVIQIDDYGVSNRRTAAGSVDNITLKVTSNSLYKLNLEKHSASFIAFKWDTGGFSWGYEIESLKEVELSDLMDDNVKPLVSEMYEYKGGELFIKTDSKVSKIEIQLINPDSSSESDFYSVAVTSNYSSGPKYSTLDIIPREEWSGDPNINDPRLRENGGPLVWYPYYYRINKIVVHHTATENGKDPIEVMRSIYIYHSLTNNWGDIGYNYIIDHNGNIYEGKLGGDQAKGYHAGAEGNPESIGIAVLGTFTDVNPTTAAQNALKKLIAEKAAFYDFTPNWQSTVFGHRDFMATACPGESFYHRLDNITVDAETYLSNNFAQIKNVTTQMKDRNYRGETLVGVFGSESSRDSFTTSYFSIDPNTSDLADWTGIENYDKKDDDALFMDFEYTNETGNYYTEDRMQILNKILLLHNDVDTAGESGNILTSKY